MFYRKCRRYSKYWLLGLIVISTGICLLFLNSSCSLLECLSWENDTFKTSFDDELLEKEGQITCGYVKFLNEHTTASFVNGSPHLGTDGPYSVLYNYFKAFQSYDVNSSVTYSTHMTTEFMKYIPDIAIRYDGPISVAVYAPSYDFCSVVLQIIKLRACGDVSIKTKVSWHIFWTKKSPPPLNWRFKPNETFNNCDIDLYLPSKSSRMKEGKGYPINVGRNIARQAAETWFMLPSDVELYPSTNLSSQFISLIKAAEIRKNSKLAQFWPRVYVTPVFEVKTIIPESKEELLSQINKGDAVYFHRYVCPHCQRIPGLTTWLQTLGKKGQLNAFSAVKRHYPYHRWEPIFICSKAEPLYDERLTWEGLQDKMSQMHELCLQNYSFVILDRGFVVHSPGIKQHSKKVAELEAQRKPFIDENFKIYDAIMQELSDKYGPNARCRKH